MTPELADQTVLPDSKPGLPSFWPGAVQPPPPLGLTVQLNEAEPEAPVESVAVTVTLLVPAVVGVPETRPEAEIDRPAGSPVAE